MQQQTTTLNPAKAYLIQSQQTTFFHYQYLRMKGKLPAVAMQGMAEAS